MPAKTINAIIKCDKCEGLLVWQTSLLGIKYPGTLWTDLKYESLNDEEPFIKCPHCSYILEPREANVVAMKKFLDFNLEENEVTCTLPTFEDYMDVLKTSILSSSVEKKMRIATVHAFNDKRRYDDLELTTDAKDNILKLLPVLENKLFIAELYRELGCFEEAYKTICSIEKTDSVIYMLIYKLIELENTKVYKESYKGAF